MKQPETIFHLGVPSSSPMYKENPHIIGSTIAEWIMLLEYAKKTGTKIVYASSSSVYNGNDIPFHEDMHIHVTDYYTECRYTMERLAKLYHDLFEVKTIGLRLFSVYGPREDYKGKYANCLTQFLWDMKKGKNPIIFGDGSQTRDLIHVDDVVNAFLTAANSDIQFGIFNVGTGNSYSFNEIIEHLNKELKTDIKPEHIINPIKNYVSLTKADTSKTTERLGFETKIDLKEGIKHLAKVYK